MAWLIRPAKKIRKRTKSKNAQEVLDRLEHFLNSGTEEPVRILCGFWKDQGDALTYQELREAVLSGDLTEETYADWSNDYSNLVKERLEGLWESAIIHGSTSQPIMDPISGIFEFNSQTPGIREWIRDRGATLVTNSTEAQRQAIQYLLAEKIQNKYTVDELAQLIRPCVGLTIGQTSAAQKFYDNMVENLKKEHPKTKEEKIRAKALDKTSKYAERLHRQRAMTIAMTESAAAYNFGADQGIRQAQGDYLIGKCIKRWSTSGDDNVCTHCDELEGEEVGMEETFFSGNKVDYTEGLFPPLHPRCACAIEYIEVETPNVNPADPAMGTDEFFDDRSNGNAERILQTITENDTPEEFVRKLNDIAGLYTDNPSAWSGIVHVTTNGPSGKYVRSTGDITLNIEKAEHKTAIHEVLHSRTIYDNTESAEALASRKMNEGAVEYLAEEICKDLGIPFSATYTDVMHGLRSLASYGEADELRFAQVLFDTPYSRRYNRIKAYGGRIMKTKELSDDQKADIAKILSDLKGGLKDGK